MKEANAQMQSYHEARELMKQGKLPSANNNNNNTNNKRGGGPPNNATVAQAGVFCLFLAAFMATPFLGKKIATDDAFRQKWVPAWYDYTVKKPEHAWTREELHEQMLQVQQDVHERAIRGEFAPDKLRELQNAMQSPYASSSYGHNNNQGGLDRSKIPKEWDKIHPGLDDNENLDESDD